MRPGGAYDVISKVHGEWVARCDCGWHPKHGYREYRLALRVTKAHRKDCPYRSGVRECIPKMFHA